MTFAGMVGHSAQCTGAPGRAAEQYVIIIPLAADEEGIRGS